MASHSSNSSSPFSSLLAFSSPIRRPAPVAGVSPATPIILGFNWAASPSGAFSVPRARLSLRCCPHFVLRYRRMRPDVARQSLITTHGGLSLEWCATICNISPMALYRVICAFGQPSLVTVLVKCRLALPAYILADEKHSHCLTEKVYLPTIVQGRLIWLFSLK